MKISEIKKICEGMDPREALVYLNQHEQTDQVLKYRDKLSAETNRLINMRQFEKQVYEHGLYNPAGLDEAGRGPLAGPVVAAAVILPKDYIVYGLNDSKKISEKRRDRLDEIIRRDAVSFSVKAIDNILIDRTNILAASKKAMLECVSSLEQVPDYLLVDAVHIDGTDIKQAGIIRGDGRSVSIAAASIIAKVYRDSMMYEYDRIYPMYGFSRNKGYGTREHIAALKKYGPCEIHRSSFIKNIV